MNYSAPVVQAMAAVAAVVSSKVRKKSINKMAKQGLLAGALAVVVTSSKVGLVPTPVVAAAAVAITADLSLAASVEGDTRR